MDLTEAKSINRILVKVHSIYEREITTKSGFKIAIDATWMKIGNTVRYGEVVSDVSVNNIGVQVGDLVFFHHHQIRPSIGHKGEMPAIGEFMKAEGLYLIEQDEIYAIQRDGQFMAIDPYCFVKPFTVKKYDVPDGKLIIPNNEKEDELSGILWKGCKELEDNGVYEGDKVVFSKNSKYVFPIGGERIFRMKADWIQCVL